MTPQDEIPEYKVLTNSFFEPDWVAAGSIVRTWATPGPHLDPLNDAAEAAMEAWYAEEVDEIDPKTKQPTGKRIRPHEHYRIRTYEAGEKFTHQVVSGPKADDVGSLSLSETMVKKSTDQRPPPSATRSRAKVAAPEEAPKAEVVVAAAPATTAQRVS